MEFLKVREFSGYKVYWYRFRLTTPEGRSVGLPIPAGDLMLRSSALSIGDHFKTLAQPVTLHNHQASDTEFISLRVGNAEYIKGILQCGGCWVKPKREGSNPPPAQKNENQGDGDRPDRAPPQEGGEKKDGDGEDKKPPDQVNQDQAGAAIPTTLLENLVAILESQELINATAQELNFTNTSIPPAAITWAQGLSIEVNGISLSEMWTSLFNGIAQLDDSHEHNANLFIDQLAESEIFAINTAAILALESKSQLSKNEMNTPSEGKPKTNAKRQEQDKVEATIL
ncbi:MAG: hypothetical protein ACR2PT_09150 [Endozoicomonas sp.]